MRPLRSFALDDPDCAPAGPALRMMATVDVRRLESLQLRCAGGVPRGLQESSLPRLADARLRRLHLSAFRTFDAALVAHVLGGQRHLEDLELGGLMARERMAGVVGAAIRAPLKRLCVIQGGAGWGAALAEMLPQWPALEAVHVSYNYFDGEELAAVLDALPATGLRELSLNGERRLPNDALMRAAERGCFGELRTLGLLLCPLSDEAVAALGDALRPGVLQEYSARLRWDEGQPAAASWTTVLRGGVRKLHLLPATMVCPLLASLGSLRSLQLDSLPDTSLVLLLASESLAGLESLHVTRVSDAETQPPSALAQHPRMRFLWLDHRWVAHMLRVGPMPELRELHLVTYLGTEIRTDFLAHAIAGQPSRTPRLQHLYYPGDTSTLRQLVQQGGCSTLQSVHVPRQWTSSPISGADELREWRA